MWHAVTPVSEDYDPILYEGDAPASLLVLNSGPGTIVARSWNEIGGEDKPSIRMELRSGNQRILSGKLVRVHLLSGEFAAVAWQILERIWYG